VHSTSSALLVPRRTFTAADMKQIHEFLARTGYVYLTGLPDTFDYLGQLTRMGDPVPQYDGEIVRDIRHDPALPTGAYSALSMQRLTPHTEWYEFPGIPPRYVALWCVRPARGAGGETTLADGYRFLRDFSTADIAILRRRVYEWYGPPSAPGGSPSVVRHPILEDHPDGLIMRYSNQFLQRTEDGIVSRYIDSGERFFADRHFDIAIDHNSVLLWDNWRMIHARNSFSDPRRHLRRLLLAAVSK